SHLSLSKAGQNFKGLCPFHSEKTPSFTVSPSRQVFHCFGCGEGGNVFSFLMKIDGATFPAAVRTLGDKYGIEVDQPVTSPAARQRTEARERLFALNREAAEFFHRTLADSAGQTAMTYLEKRGMAFSTIERFSLGYAPAGWDLTLNALTKAGAKIEDLASAGLIVAREQASRKGQDAAGYYDRFRARVMFPIRDLQKRVIGFGGRILDDGQPKYLNSPETPLFSKSRTLYGLDVAREGIIQSEQIVIVEGYFDAIALHQAGLSNVVATLGTALTSEHIELIRRFTHHVVLVFDPDAAGVRAALRTMDLFLGSGLTVQVVSLPAGEDPDTFARGQSTAPQLPKDEEVLLQLLLHEKCTFEMVAQLAAEDFTDPRARYLVLLAQSAVEGGHTVLKVLDEAEGDPASEALGRSLSLSELPYEDVSAAFQQSFTALKLRRLGVEIQETKSAQAAAERAGEPDALRNLL